MKLKTLVFSTAVLLGFSSFSLAYTIDSGATDVGSLDNFVKGAALANSSKKTETDWVNEVLGSTNTLTYEVKTETVSVTPVDSEFDGSGNVTVDNSDFGAFRLQKEPAYFLVKKGSGTNSVDGNSHWLFGNTASIDWGVVDFEALFGTVWSTDSNFTVSHVTEFAGDVSVPEPGTLALMMTGFAGLVAARCRTRKTG